ncbi:MAG: hypothetical protein ACUVWQ_03925 [Candidatus Aminicenantales bacterium]
MGIIAGANLSNSLVQGLVADSGRGRVMGIHSLSFFCFLPLGSLSVGQIATALAKNQR